MIIDYVSPDYSTAVEWIDNMTETLEQFGQLPKIESDDAWLLWATAVVQLPQVSAVNPPDPYGARDWREWADLFGLIANHIT